MGLYIFDLDGTLTDTLESIAYFGNCALAEHGLSEIPVNRYKKLVGDGMDMLVHRMLDECDASTDENFNKVRTAYNRAYTSNMTHKTAIYDGIPEMLERLKCAGHKLAVLSNKPHHVTVPIVTELFGSECFDVVYGQREGCPKKPSPDGAIEIANILGYAPSDCIFIGDTNIDIYTGKNANMTTIGVLWGFRDREELEQAGANRIVKTPNEI